jgi:hypothetical protein
MCKPKEVGALGLRDFNISDIALPSKWFGRLATNTNSLWHKVLTHKYDFKLDLGSIKCLLW